MRVLTSSVLIMQAIVLLLAIPVAVVAGGQPAWVGWLFAVLALACALLPGHVPSPVLRPRGLGPAGRDHRVRLPRRLDDVRARCGVRRPVVDRPAPGPQGRGRPSRELTARPTRVDGWWPTPPVHAAPAPAAPPPLLAPTVRPAPDSSAFRTIDAPKDGRIEGRAARKRTNRERGSKRRSGGVRAAVGWRSGGVRGGGGRRGHPRAAGRLGRLEGGGSARLRRRHE